MVSNYNLFQDKGYILLKQFIIDNNFAAICENLKKDILTEYKNLNKKSLGGYVMGNIAAYPGKYSKIIFDVLIKNGLEGIIEQITGDKFSAFNITIGGNLNLPAGYNQHFHPDAKFNNAFLIVNLATENITEFNGTLEICCNTHKSHLP